MTWGGLNRGLGIGAQYCVGAGFNHTVAALTTSSMYVHTQPGHQAVRHLQDDRAAIVDRQRNYV